MQMRKLLLSLKLILLAGCVIASTPAIAAARQEATELARSEQPARNVTITRDEHRAKDADLGLGPADHGRPGRDRAAVDPALTR